MRWPVPIALGPVLSLTACVQHSVEVEPKDAVSLVREYEKEGAVEVKYGGRTIVIERAYGPSLSVQESFLFGRVDEAPLEKVKVEGSLLVFPSDEGLRRVDPRETHEIWLRLGSYHPPDEELMLGAGVAVGGPTVYSAPFFDVRFTDWFAVEAGAFAVTRATWGHVGVRVIPVERRMLRPFVGAFVHGASYVDDDANDPPTSGPNAREEPKRRLSGVGPRLGLDWVLDSGHYAIRAEFDVVRRLSERWLFGIESPWIPWGGVSAIVYQ